ncbi:MAG: hypothetical protein ACJ72T_03015 [Nitrososphaeraceae archaeon]
MNNKGIISKISLVAIISVGVSMTTIFITPVNAQVENQTHQQLHRPLPLLWAPKTPL